MAQLLQSIHITEIDRYKQDNIPKLLLRLKTNQVGRDELIQIISTRYQVAHFFEDWLRLILKIIDSSNLLIEIKKFLQNAVEQNLKEELGEVKEYGGPHKDGRSTLLKALGIDPVVWKKNIGNYTHLGELEIASKNLINSMKTIAKQGPFEAVIALWYYENRISLDGKLGDYYLLLSAFEHRYPEYHKNIYIEGDALYHIASHAKHDTYHAKLAEDAIVKCGVSDEIVEKVCNQAQKAIDVFWNEVLM